MSPIRLGVIGLSADKSAWATSAHVGPLRSAPLSDKYTITAVATSSAKTAQAAADFHKIPADKAYHSATDIANDPDVDMVVVSVKVQKHKELTIPALNAKKDVCIEWPLGKGLQQAEELAALAKTQGVKTVVCLQARTLPIIQKAKDIIDSGALGRIVNTSLVTSSSMMGTAAFPEKFRDLNHKSSGADLISVGTAHILDPLCFLLGEFKSLNATTETTFPEISYKRADGSRTDPEPRTFADSIMVQGVLQSGATVGFINTQTTEATPGSLEWIISGEKASLKISGASSFLGLFPAKLYQHSAGEGVEGVKMDNYDFSLGGGSEWKEVDIGAPFAFGGIGHVYETFAAGKKGVFVDFDEAVIRHRMVEAIYRSAEKGTRESY